MSITDQSPAIVTASAISDRFRAAVGRSHSLAIVVQVLDGVTGEVIRQLDTVQAGQVTLDSGAAIRGRCELELIDDGTLDLVPENPTDPLAPYGNELRVCRGIRYPDGTAEVVSLGVFRIRRVDPIEESGGGLTIRVTGLDRFSRFIDARFERPYQVERGTNFTAAILAVAQDGWPGVPHDLGATSLTTPTLVAEEGEDRGEFMQSMARSMGQELFFDGGGVLRLAPHAQTSGRVNWHLTEGNGSVLLSAAKAWDAERVYNRVIASGEPLDDQPPVRGMATDDNPDSPTYYFGPFGRRPRFYVSQMIESEAQAKDAAAGILADAMGSSQQVEFGQIVNPAIRPNDVIRISRDRLRLNETHVVDEVTIPLSAQEEMRGRTRVTEVAGT